MLDFYLGWSLQVTHGFTENLIKHNSWNLLEAKSYICQIDGLSTDNVKPWRKD